MNNETTVNATATATATAATPDLAAIGAMFGTTEDIAGRRSGHNAARIEPVGTLKTGEEVFKLTFPKTEAKDGMKARVRRLMRPVKGLEACGATKVITGIVPVQAETTEAQFCFYVRVAVKA